jgi:hypothetical protein
MMQHQFERAGVPLLLKYEVDPDGVVSFQHVYVLDSHGHAHGPDLIGLFDKLLVLVDAGMAQPFLSIVAEEITCPTLTNLQ